MTSLNASAALVLFSGGQDSATCLAWALDRFDTVETLGFRYGQRHAVELQQRETVLGGVREGFPAWAGKLGDDALLDVPTLGQIGQTAMTAEVEITMGENGLPTTFVPGRNLLFLTFAATLAYRRGIKHIITGVCETDYSGYPDCRDDTIKALQATLNLGMDTRLVLHTPLMWIDKAGTWALTDRLGGNTLVELIRTHSHSCYVGDRSQMHDWGAGCGACPACDLRADGWARWTSTQ